MLDQRGRLRINFSDSLFRFLFVQILLQRRIIDPERRDQRTVGRYPELNPDGLLAYRNELGRIIDRAQTYKMDSKVKFGNSVSWLIQPGAPG